VPLPTVDEICMAQQEDEGGIVDIGAGLAADGAWWCALHGFGELRLCSSPLDRARLSSCAGQGSSGSALHTAPQLLGDGLEGVSADGFRSCGRRWLGAAPPGMMELQACGACAGLSFTGFSAAERAAHLETCNSASREERARHGALPTYTSSSDAVCQAVRQCAEEVLGSANVLTELKGQVQDGSNKRPGDVTLYFHTHTLAIDITITHVQCSTYADTQAHRPGQPVEEAAVAKRKKYKDKLKGGIRFMPFAIDDFGHIGDAGWAVLGQLAAHAAANTACGLVLSCRHLTD